MLKDEVNDESNVEAFVVGGYNYTVLVLLLLHFLIVILSDQSMLIVPFTISTQY